MELLSILLILLLVTRSFGEVAERFGQPALVGELLSGVAIGLIVRQFSGVFPVLSGLSEDEVFLAMTDLGVLFLMLMGGIELQPRELVGASAGAFVIALFGMLLPFAAGFGLGWMFLPASDVRISQCLFLGTALSITAVPVAVRVLMDLGRLESKMGNLVVSAAIFDDVFSLVILAILTGVLDSGSFPGVQEMAWLGARIALFFIVTTAAGVWLFPIIGRWMTRLYQEEFEFSALLLVTLAFSVLAELLGLHFILGAFLAGVFFGRRTAGSEVFHDVKRKVSAITSGFLAPIFFASIGLHLTLSAVVEIPLFLTLLIAAAFLTKLLGAGIPALLLDIPRRDAWGIGMAMSARGAVELIIADIAFRAGLFSRPEPAPPVVSQMFSAVVLVAITTTVLTPIALGRMYRRSEDPAGEEE